MIDAHPNILPDKKPSSSPASGAQQTDPPIRRHHPRGHDVSQCPGGEGGGSEPKHPADGQVPGAAAAEDEEKPGLRHVDPTQPEAVCQIEGKGHSGQGLVTVPFWVYWT